MSSRLRPAARMKARGSKPRRFKRAAATMSAMESGAQRRHVVVLGGGIQGASAAYFLSKRDAKVTVVELESVGSAASGKAGGFLAGEWGSGPTTALHKESFRMHKELASELELETFREIRTLSVASGSKGQKKGLEQTMWLDGNISQARLMDDKTAQVTPLEITTKLMEAAKGRGAEVVIGRATGVEFRDVVEGKGDEEGGRRAEGVVVRLPGGDETTIGCTDVLVAAGVWSSLMAPYFGLPEDAWPITGIKSTHVIWKNESGSGRDAIRDDPAALFCAEEPNGTHLELYPRSNGDLYACGIGGSDYVEDRTRLAEGGDCETPSRVKADVSRIKAAQKSAGILSSLLAAEPEHVGACIRPCPPDGLPYMGLISTSENCYISAGHNCWGILWGPVSGKLMSELIMDGAAVTADISSFSPSRFLPKARRGGKGRKMVDVDVGEQVSPPNATSLAKALNHHPSWPLLRNRMS